MFHFLVFAALLITGCDSTRDVVDNGYRDLCKRQPDSVSCIQNINKGIAPEYSYLESVSNIMRFNFTYKYDKDQYNIEEYWLDNITINHKLIGDCDDISLTFASQLILDGVSPKNIKFMVSGIGGRVKHYYIKVKMDNGEIFDFYKIDEYDDILYMSYDNVGVFNSI